MAVYVCGASSRVLFRSSDLLCSRAKPAASLFLPITEARTSSRRKGRFYCKDVKQGTSRESDKVTIGYIQGLPHITVPLPSRSEKCRFALKPVSHTVFNLIEMLKLEDRGVDRAILLNEEGVRIAQSCSIESLLNEPFWLHINDKKYKVIPPKRDQIVMEDLSKLGEIRALVGQLYEALSVGEYHRKKEEELVMRLEELKYRLIPMEEFKAQLSLAAERKANFLMWAGLGFMALQFGILARLTWWEYSWDIMEPVTYFVTYGTAMAGYAFYLTTKMEYDLPQVKERHFLIHLHKNAKKRNFDVNEYNNLKRQVAEIEYDLRRIRDPLNLQFVPVVGSRKGPQHTREGSRIKVEQTKGLTAFGVIDQKVRESLRNILKVSKKPNDDQ